MKKKPNWYGYVCVLPNSGVAYSPIFPTREEAVNYSRRPKGTEVVKVAIYL